jgi:hypothetical protein
VNERPKIEPEIERESARETKREIDEAGNNGGVASERSQPPVVKAKPRLLPLSRWAPLIVGACVGIVLRLVFSGKPGAQWSAMSSAFLYFAPFAVGAETVFFMERRARAA